MKQIVISLPAMGKTTLVKMARARNWSNGTGVDFDLKGLNQYSRDLSVSCTAMCNDMFAAGKQFITAFNGCINFNVLDEDTEVFFVGPADEHAMNAALKRSFERGDSLEFVDAYAANILEWSVGLYNAFVDARDCIGESRCHYIGVRGLGVLPEAFTIQEDGSLRFNGYNHTVDGKILWPKFAHHPSTTVRPTDIINPVDDQISKFASYLSPRKCESFFSLPREEQFKLVKHIPYLYYTQLEADRHGYHITIMFEDNSDDCTARYLEVMDQFRDDSCEDRGWYIHNMNAVSFSPTFISVSYSVEYYTSECEEGESFDYLNWARQKTYYIFNYVL
jgi:hypothetical protein